MNRILIGSGWLGLVVGLLSSCQPKKSTAEGQATSTQPIMQVVGVARIEPELGLIDVYAGTSGTITTRLVAEGQSVMRGQALLTLDRQAEAAQVRQSRARLQTHLAAIDAQAAQVELLRLQADKAQADHELNRDLFATKGITLQTLRDSEASTTQRRQEYRKGQADLRQAQAKRRELNADLDYYAVQARQKTVRASYAGQVLTWEVNPGDYVTAQTKIAQLAPSGSLVAVTEVDEVFADRVRYGQRADIKSQATGGVVANGRVIYAANFLKKKSLFSDETTPEDRRVREVKVRLAPNGTVLVNSRVDCVIYLN